MANDSMEKRKPATPPGKPRSAVQPAEAYEVISRMRENPEGLPAELQKHPEYADVLISAIENGKDAIDQYLQNDRERSKRSFDAIDAALAGSEEDSKRFYGLLSQAQANFNKYLDSPDLTPEERLRIHEQSIEHLRMAEEENRRSREFKKEIVSSAKQTVDEGRDVGRTVLGVALIALSIVTGVGSAAFGGWIKLK